MSTGIKNNKALIFLVVFLLLSNIGLLLYFLVFNRSGSKNGPGRKGDFSIVDYVKKEVGFTDEQSIQFVKLHEENRDTLKILGENIRVSKNELFKLLREGNAPDSLITVAAGQLAENQKKMELTMFYHFKKVRTLCKPEQQVKFDSLVSRMNNRSPWFRRGGTPRSDREKDKK